MTAESSFNQELSVLDPEVHAAIGGEITRQRDASPQRFTADDDEAQRLLVEFIRRSLPIPKR